MMILAYVVYAMVRRDEVWGRGQKPPPSPRWGSLPVPTATLGGAIAFEFPHIRRRVVRIMSRRKS